MEPNGRATPTPSNAMLQGCETAEPADASTPWRRWHCESDDIDDQARMLPAWAQAYVQLERGRFESVVDGVQLGEGLSLFRKCTNRRLHKVFAAPGDTRAVVLLTQGSDGILFQNREACSGDVLLLPPGQAVDIVTHGRFDVIVAMLDTRHAPPGLPDELERGAAILPASATTHRLAEAMQAILTGEEAGPSESAPRQRLLRARLACHVVECLGWPGRAGDVVAVRGPVTVVDAARRLLLAEAQTHGRAMPVPELAQRLGVSVRQLHKLFHARLGMPPRVYAERLRLSRARSDLRGAGAGSTTVAAVATKWGFWHLGRFASAYRAAFGELPSDTARA